MSHLRLVHDAERKLHPPRRLDLRPRAGVDLRLGVFGPTRFGLALELLGFRWSLRYGEG